jgi:nucleotide-binding universal stress UspA family protein
MAIAEVTGGVVILLNVPFVREVYPVSSVGYEAMVPTHAYGEFRDSIQDYLENLVAVWNRPNVRIQRMIVEGDEAGVIVDVASAEDVDLIVMTTHGRTGLTRWVLGSVTERVLRDAPCPVMTMRSNAPVENVLITLDGSNLAEHALKPGLAVARALGADVHLLTVSETAHVGLVDIAEAEVAAVNGVPVSADDEYAVLTRYMDQLCRGRDWDGVNVSYEVISGKAVEAILDYADANVCDLIVMATHGRSGLRRWLYGSVTSKVMRSANRAMLIIRPPEQDLRTS